MGQFQRVTLRMPTCHRCYKRYLLSWNFKHIVRRKTRDIVRMVNTLNNFRQIEIMALAELL